MFSQCIIVQTIVQMDTKNRTENRPNALLCTMVDTSPLMMMMYLEIKKLLQKKMKQFLTHFHPPSFSRASAYS